MAQATQMFPMAGVGGQPTASGAEMRQSGPASSAVSESGVSVFGPLLDYAGGQVEPVGRYDLVGGETVSIDGAGEHDVPEEVKRGELATVEGEDVEGCEAGVGVDESAWFRVEHGESFGTYAQFPRPSGLLPAGMGDEVPDSLLRPVAGGHASHRKGSSRVSPALAKAGRSLSTSGETGEVFHRRQVQATVRGRSGVPKGHG